MATQEIILLSDSEDELATITNMSSVARIQSPRTRELARDDDDSDIVVIDTPATGQRKRPRRSDPEGLKNDDFKTDPDHVEVLQIKSSPKKKALPPTPLETVLNIFPDVCLKHAHKLLSEHKNVAANVVDVLVDGRYPKEPGKKKSVAGGSATVGAVVKIVSQEPTFDFFCPSSFEPWEHDGYIEQAIDQLTHLFPCLTKSGAKFVMGKSSNHFAIAHDKIVCCLKGGENNGNAAMGDDAEVKQFKRLKACMDEKAIFDEDQKRIFRAIFGTSKTKGFFSTRPRAKDVHITNPILAEEVSFVMSKLKKWKDQVEAGIIRKENRELSIKDGTALDCACCYEQVAMEEMVQCRAEGHLFCQDCLSSYVENQVFANGNFGMKPGTKEPALELLCFHGGGCGSGFDRFFLEKALKEKVLERYDELQSQVNLEKAGLRDTMCTCPKCGFSAEVPASVNVFLCPNGACGFESCKKCREESHVPLRCAEVEKKAESEGRHRVEEAASAAVIRFCPKCNKGIVKSDGCNKMTCGCGTKFCYLCRTVVRDYTHFCQTPHCDHSDPRKCKNKCPLYTKDLEKEHEKNMREAALAEAKRVEAEAAAAASSQPQKKVSLFGEEDSKPAAKVNIDVESILQAPAKRPRI